MPADEPVTAPLASSNARIKRLRRLVGRRSARLDDGAFVIEGPTNVAEAIRSGIGLEEVFAEERLLPLGELGRPVTAVRDGVLRDVLSTDAPQPVCAVAPTALHRPLDEVVSGAQQAGRPVLVLVDVSDPGNVGTLLRSAEAAGAGGVVLGGDSVDLYSPKVVRASAGSIFRVSIAVEPSIPRLLDGLGALTRWAAAADGSTSHLDAGLAGAVAIVLGNEAHGLRPDVRSGCSETVRVEMDGPAESLNVAMAGTVLVFEALRQRRRGA